MIFKEFPTPDCGPGVGQNAGQAKCKKTHTILHFVPRSAELRNTAPSKKNDALSASELSKNFWLHGSDDLSNSSLTTHHSQLFCHFIPYAVQGFICEIDKS